MSGKAILDFHVVHFNAEGEAFRNISTQKCDELGIKTEKELEARRAEFPAITLGLVLDVLFDLIPLPSTSIFALYNNILLDIKEAKGTGKTSILLDKEDLEKFKKLFEKSIEGKPELNRRLGFVTAQLDNALANCLKA